MAERIRRVWLLLFGVVWMSSACVSTEELYADYDDHLCPVIIESATGSDVARSSTGQIDPQRVVDRSSGDVFLFPSEIFFEHDSYALGAVSREDLDLVLVILDRYPSLNLELSGFTSHIGGSVYNKRLAERRVAIVYAYIAGAGIDVSRMVKQGVGPDIRKFLSDSVANEAVNRRVGLALLDASGREVRQQFTDLDDLAGLPERADLPVPAAPVTSAEHAPDSTPVRGTPISRHVSQRPIGAGRHVR
jgi:outer membrane protein OmpA-like peptidoglycan-associated protein